MGTLGKTITRSLTGFATNKTGDIYNEGSF